MTTLKELEFEKLKVLLIIKNALIEIKGHLNPKPLEIPSSRGDSTLK